MHSELREHGAEDCVVGIRRHGSDHVSGIDILDLQWLLHLLKKKQEFLLKPQSDVCKDFVTTSVGGTRALDQRVAATLCHHEDYMFFCLDEVQAMFKQLRQRDVHLGKQANVDVPRCQRSFHGNETTTTPHQLHDADAMFHATCLHVGSIDRPFSFCHSSVEAKGIIQHCDVIINRLWHAHDGTLIWAVLQLLHSIKGLHATLVRAVPANDKILFDSHALQGFCNF
mmetsp:Transcript_20058/g.50056  ORF Transcript_20058/g.50056 Transcript_20058/m.50056 type:complete len:226 (+) Transcript_20058:6928-7605(+)